METTITRDTLVCKFHIDKTMNLHIIVYDREYGEEYAVVINEKDMKNDDCSYIKFEGNTPSIKTVNTLQKIIIDGVGTHNSSIIVDVEKNGIMKTLVLVIQIDLTYIDGTMRITLSSTNRNPTIAQITEMMDYRLERITRQFRNKIDRLEKENVLLMNDIVVLKEEIVSHEERDKIKFRNIIDRFRVIPLFWFNTGYRQWKPVMENISDITITDADNECYLQYSGSELRRYYIEPHCPMVYLKYMTGLKRLHIKNRKELENLAILQNCKKLNKLTIEDCENLRTVKDIVDFTKLTEITIKGKHRIVDIGILAKCKSLQILNLSRGTNTIIFGQHTHFQITMI